MKKINIKSIIQKLSKIIIQRPNKDIEKQHYSDFIKSSASLIFDSTHSIMTSCLSFSTLSPLVADRFGCFYGIDTIYLIRKPFLMVTGVKMTQFGGGEILNDFRELSFCGSCGPCFWQYMPPVVRIWDVFIGVYFLTLRQTTLNIFRRFSPSFPAFLYWFDHPQQP